MLLKKNMKTRICFYAEKNKKDFKVFKMKP